MLIKQFVIIYCFIMLVLYLLKIFLMNYQKEIKKKYNYIPQKKMSISSTDIDRQHEPYNSTDVYEYGIFRTHIFKHPNDIDIKLADLKGNIKIMDAGCGMLGPSINFSKKIPSAKIFAVSNGKSKHKKVIISKIKENKLENKIIPVFMDYHDMDKKFKNNSLDRIVFIESIGFSNDILNLLKKCHKLLKKGGKVYIRTIIIPNTKNKYLEDQFNNIQKNLNGNLYYNQNMIYFLQNSGFKNIKVTRIPLMFSDNADNMSFLATIDRLGLYQLDKLLISNLLVSGSYIATK